MTTIMTTKFQRHEKSLEDNRREKMDNKVETNFVNNVIVDNDLTHNSNDDDSDEFLVVGRSKKGKQSYDKVNKSNSGFQHSIKPQQFSKPYYGKLKDDKPNDTKPKFSKQTYGKSTYEKSPHTKQRDYTSNNQRFNSKKMYQDTAEFDSVVKAIISKNLSHLANNSTTDDFIALLNTTTKKSDRAAVLEKAISYHLWEIFSNERIRKELAEISEGDGYPAMHWIVWPAYTSKEGHIEGFSRTNEDIIKVVEVLGQSGCDPLKLSGKRGENAFESLDGAILLNANGHNNKKGTFEPGELGVGGDKKSFYTDLFLSIPRIDASARIMIREVLNTVNKDNIDKFRTKFCFVFHENPCVVIQELIKIFYQLTSSVRNGVGEWIFIRDAVAVCREMIKLGPNISDIKQIVIVQYLQQHWNSVEQQQIFNDFLATQAITTAELITDAINKLNNSTENKKSNSNFAADTFCTESKGAIVGESNVLPFQLNFMKESIDNGEIIQCLCCLSHMQDPFNKEMDKDFFVKLFNKFDSFDSSAKAILSNIIAAKNQWTIQIEGSYDDTPFSKIFYAYLVPDIKKYIGCIINDNDFDPTSYMNEIRINITQIINIKATNIQLLESNAGKSMITIPDIAIKISKYGNIIAQTIINGSTTTINYNKSDKVITEKITSTIENVNKFITSSVIQSDQQNQQNKQKSSKNVLIPKSKSSEKLISKSRFEALSLDDEIDDNEIDDTDNYDDFEPIYDYLVFNKFSHILDTFGRIETEMTESEPTEYIKSVFADIFSLAKEENIYEKNIICQYLILTAIAKFSGKTFERFTPVLVYVIKQIFTSEEISNSYDNLKKNIDSISDDNDFSPAIVNKVMTEISKIK